MRLRLLTFLILLSSHVLLNAHINKVLCRDSLTNAHLKENQGTWLYRHGYYSDITSNSKIGITRKTFKKEMNDSYDRETLAKMHEKEFTTQSRVNLLAPDITAPIFKHGITPQQESYLEMAYIPGQSFKEITEGTAPALNLETLKERLIDLRKVFLAVQKLHSHGIAHLDLNPGNIMKTPTGEIKLIDFAFSLELQGDTIKNPEAVMLFDSSNYYAAPELRSDTLISAVGTSSDIYTLGIVSREYLAPFFTSKDPKIQSVLTSYVYSLLSKAIDRKISKRPNAEALGREIENVLSRLP